MFRDRKDAGRLLAAVVAERLTHPWGMPPGPSGVVLGLPRGGVPVAAEVAALLGFPLDVLVVRKIGVPWHPELALGAVGEGGAVVLNDAVVSSTRISADDLDALVRRASHEVQDTVGDLRPTIGPPEVAGRMVIVVDDGVATGATARAAAEVLRQRGSGQVILATPVASPSTRTSLGACFDDVICLSTPSSFASVGRHYEQFEQVASAEVRRLLRLAST